MKIRRTNHVVAVVYDDGAVGPGDIVAASSGLCRVVFVCDRSSPHVAGLFPILSKRAAVCDITAMTPFEAAEALSAWAVDGITTFSESCLEATASLAQLCGLQYHSMDTVHLLTDKLAQRDTLRASGVDETRAVAVVSPEDADEAVDAVGLPAIVKPRRGFASRGVLRVDGIDECRSAIADLQSHPMRLGPLMVEEYLVGVDPSARSPWGDSVTVEALIRGGSVGTVAVTGRCRMVPPFREQGLFLPSMIDAAQATEVSDLAAGAVEALGVQTGVTHVEIKFTPGGPRVVEVHGRLGGYIGDLLRRSGNVDIVAAGLALAVGEDPGTPTYRPDGVVFQYFLVPPTEAVGVRRMSGIQALRDLPGVEAVDVRAHTVEGIDWRCGTATQMGTVYGKVKDHGALAELLSRIDAIFVPEYVYRGDEVQQG